MAEVPDQILTNITKALNDINTTLSATKIKGAKAAGTSSGSAVTDSFVRLYKTVSDADSAIQKPISQVGTALEDLGGIAKGALPSWLPFGDSVKGFIGTITKGGKVLADHNQKLLDFSQGLAGSAGLSINSFSELTKQLSTANLGMADFQRVQADAANFLSTMGGELRGASGQARLLSDVTNVVNDDFEKLGQMGVSLAEKQQLQADSMVMLRQIGLDAGTTSQQAAQMVSGAMQNMAMEANKMAALTGVDRRKTMAGMQEKIKTDADLAITAELVAEANGHTAEQAAVTRQNFANLDGVMSAMGPTGEKLKKVMADAAETGVPFITLLGDAEPKLAQLISGNDEYINGIQGLIDKSVSGEVLDVTAIAEVQKGLADSVNNNARDAALLSEGWKDEFRNIKLAEVRSREFALKASQDVEIQTEKHAESVAGQAANMAQVGKDALTQAQNFASIFATISTEVFNDQFADDSKAMRESIKTAGSTAVSGMVDVRDTLMGVRSLADDTTGAMKELVDYSDAELATAKKKLEAGLDMLGMDKKQQEAWIEAAGLQEVQAARIKELSDKEAALKKKINDKAQAMLDSVKEGYEFTEAELLKGANTIDASVSDLSSAIERIRAGVKADAAVAESTAEAGKGVVEQLKELRPELQRQALNQIAKLDGHFGKSDKQYDDLIASILTDKTVNLGDETKLLLADIRDKSNTNKLVEDIINATVNKDGAGAEQTAVISKLDAIIKLLMDIAGKPPVVVEDRPWLEELRLIKKAAFKTADNTD